ncbi:MAG: 3-methyl-2-oxobutanoate dehydrogenase subunit VorB [Candidatus Aureabacteria bacterium]|nr:3-methyl-2-oxobutanoate dehydrogenase subunit VorB [Candidatus Auribacterota bacterium]
MKKNIFNDDFLLLSGNEIMAETAIRAGCRYYFGYPITPQNEIPAYMSRRMPQVDGVFIQAESELAAISMVMGAAITGKRALTSSSSPGISLKQEGISYLAGCELPAVIINVMRGGPGLGNIGPSQSDYFQATKGGGHGDYHTLVYGPTTLEETVSVIYSAFEKAEKYRLPVMILVDGIMGQIMEHIKLPRMKKNNKKNFSWALDGCSKRAPRKIRSLYLKKDELFLHNKKLQKKYAKIEQQETLWHEWGTKDADKVVIAYGSPGRLVEDVVKKKRSNKCKIGYLRPITLWPFPGKRICELSKRVKKFLVVEMNEGQMVEDIIRYTGKNSTVEFCGKSGGTILYAEDIEKAIDKMF